MIDPGAVLHVLRRSGMTLDALENQLERESGLHAMTGTSGDVRDLEAAIRSGDVSARLPLDHLSLRDGRLGGWHRCTRVHRRYR